MTQQEVYSSLRRNSAKTSDLNTYLSAGATTPARAQQPGLLGDFPTPPDRNDSYGIRDGGDSMMMGDGARFDQNDALMMREKAHFDNNGSMMGGGSGYGGMPSGGDGYNMRMEGSSYGGGGSMMNEGSGYGGGGMSQGESQADETKGVIYQGWKLGN